MATPSPLKTRLAIVVVVVGAALIGQRVVSPATADEGAVVAPAARQRAALAPAGVAPPGDSGDAKLHLERLDARQHALAARAAPKPSRAASGPLFDAVSWRPPPPPPPPAAPPPRPVAPRFPYTYIGGLVEDKVRTVFFEKGERVLTVKAGDTVDGVYRVDTIHEQQMQLTYLPLAQPLTVAFGATR